MELSPDFVRKQLRRLRGFYGFLERADELERVVKKRIRSERHLERVVDEIVDNLRPNEDGFAACPTPAEMADHIRAVPAQPVNMKAPTPDCELCAGTGFVMRNFGDYEAAEPCACRSVKEKEFVP